MSHSHHHPDASAENRLLWAMVLTGTFMVAEVVGGIMSGSLALLSDAGHMLADVVSLALAWTAFRLGRRSGDPQRSYGYHRFQVLAAFVNGLTLFVIAGWILSEAVARIAEPIPVLAGPMLVIAVLGLVVNIAAFAVLHVGLSGENLNLRGAALHVLGDLLGSVAAIVAALVIMATGWFPIDPILSVLAAAIILKGAYQVVRRAGHILLEGTPENLDPAELSAHLVGAVPAVSDVHHVHIWSLTGERPVITLHAVLRDGADHNETLRAIQTALKDAYSISHSTIQLEHGICLDDHGHG